VSRVALPPRALANSPQPLLRHVGDDFDVGLADQLQHDLRVEESDHYATRRFLTHDHVARQQQTDIRNGVKGLVRQSRVACTQNAVGRQVHAELFLHRVLHVDVAGHSHFAELDESDRSEGWPRTDEDAAASRTHVFYVLASNRPVPLDARRAHLTPSNHNTLSRPRAHAVASSWAGSGVKRSTLTAHGT